MRWLSTFVAVACLPAAGLAQSPLFERTDTQAEIEMGRSTYDEILRNNLLSRNAIDVARANRVFSTLVSALPKKLYPFQVVVIAGSDINAFCLPGGYICIYEGLLSQIKKDGDLAAVLGHEMGHAIHRDYSRMMMDLRKSLLFGMLVFRNSDDLQNFLGNEQRSFSRSEESQADAFGTELYLRAGYDPAKAGDPMLLLEHLSPDNGAPIYTRDHPPTMARYKDILQLRDKLLANGLKPDALLAEPPYLGLTSIFGNLPAVSVAANPYFPLREGAEWGYEVRANGTSSSYSVTVVGVSHTDSGDIARMQMQIGSSKINYQCLTTEDGVWRRNRPEKENADWNAEMILPALYIPPAPTESTVDSVEKPHPIAYPDSKTAVAGKWTFKDMGTEDVSTPCGRYSGALRVEATDGVRTLDLWFAKDVGLVRRYNPASGVDELLYRLKLTS